VNGARVLIIGYDREGELWVQSKMGQSAYTVGSRCRKIYESWTHIPECTGWGWQMPQPRKEVLWIIESLTGEFSKKWVEVGQDFHIACANAYKTHVERTVVQSFEFEDER
jgi:hypothetical protein